MCCSPVEHTFEASKLHGRDEEAPQLRTETATLLSCVLASSELLTIHYIHVVRCSVSISHRAGLTGGVSFQDREWDIAIVWYHMVHTATYVEVYASHG